MLLGFSNAMMAVWIPAMLLKWLKDRISVPRMGYVTFRPRFSTKVVKNTAKIIISLMVFPLLFLIIFQNSHPRIDAFLAVNLELIIGVFLALLVIAAGITTGTPRYTVYGSGLILLSILSRLNIVQFSLVFVVSGGFFLLVGSAILIRFIIKNPIVDP